MRSLNTGKDLLHWLANVDEDGIAWLHLQTDGKSVNVLTHAVMAELGSLVDQLEASDCLLYTSPIPRDTFESRLPA